MLAALDLRSVLVGMAAGGLTATVAGLAVGSLLALLGVTSGPDIGLLSGVLVGMATAGWVAGRFAIHSHRFHGSVSALLFSGILILVASASSADYTLGNILLVALLGIGIGGAGGWLGGRRRARTALK